jgi:hypothetical protein
MPKQFIVLDQNILREDRKSPLKEWLDTRSDMRYVLPDLAFLEMTKTVQWESTLSNSLRLLSHYPARVHVCYSVNEGLDFELTRLRSINGHMLHPKATAFVRNLLDSVRNETDGYALDRIRSDPENHREALAKDHLDHTQNKLSLCELIKETKNSLSDDIQKCLRANKVTDSERLQIIYKIVVDLLPQILAENGVSYARARAFMKHKPLILRYLFLKVWYNIYWIGKGGIDSFPEKDVSNEELDKQYVLSASFFHGILSNDNRVNDSYRDLCILLKMKI